MFHRVREGWDEPRIVHGFSREVGRFLVASEERLLLRPSAAVRLHPLSRVADERASPYADRAKPELRVRDFQDDAADVLIAKVISTGEVLVQRTQRIKEERIAAPPSEEAVVAGFRYVRLRPGRDRRPIDDHVTGV